MTEQAPQQGIDPSQAQDQISQGAVDDIIKANTSPGEYAHLVDPSASQPESVEAAAVRPEPAAPQSPARRQMDIAAADRQNREAANLPPRPIDI